MHDRTVDAFRVVQNCTACHPSKTSCLHDSGHPTPQHHRQRAHSYLQHWQYTSYYSSRWRTSRHDLRDKGQYMYCLTSDDLCFRHACWCVALFLFAGPDDDKMVAQSIRRRSTRPPWSSSVMQVPKSSGKPTATSLAWGMSRLVTTTSTEC